MPHQSHDFQNLNFHGAHVQACRLCGLDARDVEGAEKPCRVSDPQGQSAESPLIPLVPKTPVVFPNPPTQASLMGGLTVGPSPNYREIIASLNAESIRQQISVLESELSALRIFLTAAEAKEKANGAPIA